MKIENFMQALKEYRSPLVFNPWRDYDPKCDISSDAPVIRAANLTRYLQLRQKAHYLFFFSWPMILCMLLSDRQYREDSSSVLLPDK